MRSRLLIRYLSLILVTALTFSASIYAAPNAQAASKPRVSAVAAKAGPLTPSRVVISGSGLRGANKVRFGKAYGKIVRRVSATKIIVNTPRHTPGTVSVTVHTRAGWSRPSKKARYTFVAKPSFATMTPTQGYYTGGTTVTIAGTNLSATTAVMFGELRASIVSRTLTRLVVKTPIGVVGSTNVTVVSPGGTSTKAHAFTYTLAPESVTSSIQPKSTTLVPDSVQWVIGGWDQDAGKLNDWTVSLPAGAALPTVGAGFLLKPGSRVFPSGLAGKVSAIAAQTDGSSRVTVTPASLNEVMTKAAIGYSGNATPALAQAKGGVQRSSSDSPAFPIDRSALECEDTKGKDISFGADLDLSMKNVNVTQSFSMGGIFDHPSYSAVLAADVELEGKLHLEAASTCKVKAAWANAHRRTVFLGSSGLTLSVAPDIEFSLSAGGSFGLSTTTRTTMSVSTTMGGTPAFNRTSKTLSQRVTGEGGFSVELAAGVTIQFGLLDRVGVAADLLVALNGALMAKVNPLNVCISAKLLLKLKLKLFVDVFVARWESPALTASITLYTFANLCMVPDDESPDTGTPAITSSRLPDAIMGANYTAQLTTADGRQGTWQVASGALPPGLSLDPSSGSISGTVSGTSSEVVADYATQVSFIDEAGKSATTVVRLRVLPATGLQGGALQLTLTWSGAADLDLHTTDPSGEEIYYSHPESDSGGQLDHDANAGCEAQEASPVENIYWPPSAAPRGSYTVRVDVYSECQSDDLAWHLTVRNNGVVVMDKSGTGGSEAYAFTVNQDGSVTPSSRQIAAPQTVYPRKH